MHSPDLADAFLLTFACGLEKKIDAYRRPKVRKHFSLSVHPHPCELTSQRQSRYRHGAALHEAAKKPKDALGQIMVLFRTPRHELDPLDLEILEKAFDAAWAALKENVRPDDLDSDEGLEAVLRRELIEIACFNGVSEPETLRDILLARLPRNATD
jgi:hypothetical protein